MYGKASDTHPAGDTRLSSGTDSAGDPSTRPSRWPLERVLFAMAGTMTLVSVALVALVSPWFLILTAFVGVNQWLYVAVGACPASVVLKRLFGLRSAVYPCGRSRGAGARSHPPASDRIAVR
ncbi:MAG TPA: hypothetical protein VFL56_03715 [Solirubrobacterales bacterium]|nr:hypothetical protein [Solirubrobacterales bacterium]